MFDVQRLMFSSNPQTIPVLRFRFNLLRSLILTAV